VIDYQQAAEFGLGISLFERYAAPPQKKAKQSAPTRRPVPKEERHFLRLNVQYRMVNINAIYLANYVVI